MTISEATRKVLERYPYLDRYMAEGVVNYRGLAKQMLPQISKILGSTPNVQSVVTALRRVPVHKSLHDRSGLDRILSKSTVSLRYDIAALTFPNGMTAQKMSQILTDSNCIILQGMETITVLADERSIEKLRSQLRDETVDFQTSLAIVVVKSPKEITKTPGVLAYLSNILALERINIVEMMSSHAETSFVVEERDALKTVDVLRKEVKRARSPLKRTSTAEL